MPAAWLVKECHRVAGVFSLGEALYCAFNPLSLGLFAAVALQLSVWELIVGSARRAPLAVLAALLALGAAFALYAGDSGGREAFYAYIALYRKLFGG